MKKLVIVFFLFVFVAGFVVAAGGSGSADSSGVTASGAGITNSELKESAQGTGQGIAVTTTTTNAGEASQIQEKTRLQTGNSESGTPTSREQGQDSVMQGQDSSQSIGSKKFMSSSGKEIELKSEDGQILQVKTVQARSRLELISEQSSDGVTTLKTKLSTGKSAEIKIMPDTASEKAIAQLQLKNCVAEQGCTIELKEVGSKEQVKAAYEIKTQKEAKVFGLFKTKMRVQAQIDAETGEVISASKSWWAFLASEKSVSSSEDSITS